MGMKYLSSGEKKKLHSQLDMQFGIDKMKYMFIETGKQKIRGFSGTMTKDELNEISRLVRIETVGMYLVKKDRDLRLSLDATQVLADQITKGIIELDDEEFDLWIHGKDLEKEHAPGVWVMKYREDFVGCTISTGKKLLNHVPKERRVRKS